MFMISTKLACTLVLATAASWAMAADNKITFAGSSTIIPVMESLDPVFKKHGVDAAIQGGGSSAAFKAVRDGMADIGMVSRSLSASELERYHHFAFAGDLIVMIVHQSNDVVDVDDQMVHDIFSGKKTRWASGRRITVISKESGRATQDVFERHFKLFGQIVRKAVIIGANGQAIASVENDRNAIAYVSFDSAIAAQKNGSAIKILSLNGIAPSIQSARAGKYQLTRELNLIYTSENIQPIEKIREILNTAEADSVMTQHSIVNYGKI